MTRNRATLFRLRGEHDHAPVTNIELFFDLVFVFAITQLSHHLLTHLSLSGALETLMLFLAVWWVWIYTSWATNWLDPDKAHVRLMLIAMMLGGLALSGALPTAFEQNGVIFAGSYCAMQLGRSAYLIWAAYGVNHGLARNFTRIFCYFLASSLFWLWGAQLDFPERTALWAIALLIEYAGPFTFFRIPILGRSTLSDWDISGAHMAERCSLFIIIALGEAVLVTGATYANLAHDNPTVVAFITSFIGSAAMWWIYFDMGAARGSSVISNSGNAGQIARNAYTYLHMPIVAGIVVTAVADELLLAHPSAPSSVVLILTATIGPMLFLIGNQMFKWITSDLKYPPLSHFIGMLLLLSCGVGAYFYEWQSLGLAIAGVTALLLTAIWEWISFHGGWQKWAPWLQRKA